LFYFSRSSFYRNFFFWSLLSRDFTTLLEFRKILIFFVIFKIQNHINNIIKYAVKNNRQKNSILHFIN
jgi:hypothetical protein